MSGEKYSRPSEAYVRRLFAITAAAGALALSGCAEEYVGPARESGTTVATTSESGVPRITVCEIQGREKGLIVQIPENEFNPAVQSKNVLDCDPEK